MDRPLMNQAVSVVIPMRNEAGNVVPLIDELQEKLSDREYELIFINDGSTDHTLQELETCRDRDPNHINVIDLQPGRGKQQALLEGFSRCRFPLVLTMDGDRQDDPSYVFEMEKYLEEGNCDVVLGARTKREEPSYRIWGSRTFRWLLEKRFGVSFLDPNTPFRLIRKPLIENLDLRNGEFRFLPIRWATNGYKVAELPVVQRERTYGRSKFLGPWRIVEALFILWTLPAKQSNRSIAFSPLNILFALVSLLLLFAFVNISEPISVFSKASPLMLLALAGLNLLSVGIKGMRSKCLLKTWNVSESCFRTASTKPNPIAESSLQSGETSEDTGHHQNSVFMTARLAAQLYDATFLFLLAIPALFSLLPVGNTIVFLIAACCTMVFIAITLLVRIDFKWGIALPGSLAAKEIENENRGRKPFWVALFTIVGQVLFLLSAWLLARHIGMDLPFWNLVLVVLAVQAITSLHLTIMGLGLREWTIFLFLSAFGVSQELTFSYIALFFLCFPLPEVLWERLGAISKRQRSSALLQ